MPKKLDFKNLRLCLDNYEPLSLFIRLFGSRAAEMGVDACKVDEKLEGRALDFKKNDSGLYMLIDSEEVFHFPLEEYTKGFFMEYERIIKTEGGIEKMVFLSHGIDPYDPDLPEPSKSTLVTDLDWHYMRIEFEGRIDLRFHSWKEKPHWKYWTVTKPKKKNL